jgi:protein SCO1/2
MKIRLTLLALALSLFSVAHSAPSCCSANAGSDEAAVAETDASDSLFQLPVTWTTDEGRETTLAALRGHPVVVAMFFAKCEYACPLLVNDMRRLRAALPANVRDDVRFVLVSFDVERDSVDALHAYRSRQALDDHWSLLRGSAEDVRTLAAILGVQFKKDARGQFAHSNVLTLLNTAGEISYQHVGLNGDLTLLAAAASKAAL